MKSLLFQLGPDPTLFSSLSLQKSHKSLPSNSYYICPRRCRSSSFKPKSMAVSSSSSSEVAAAAAAAKEGGGNAKKESKLWGGRFEESVTDAVERFSESISYDKALYKHDIMGSKAHASMLAHQVCFPFCCLV